VGRITSARAHLQVTTIPADAQALIAQITALIITQRGQQGAVLDDQDGVAAFQSANDSAAATLARAGARVASVRAAIAGATAGDKKRQGNRDAVAAPLKTLKADATAYLSGQSVTHATTRVGKNFPAEIITIAKRRHDTRVGRLATLQGTVNSAEDALGTGQAADGGLGGQAAKKAIAFERAQAELEAYVAGAASRFVKAKAVIDMLEKIDVDVTNTVPDMLSAAEKAQLTALAAAGAAAESTAEALDTDFQAVFSAEDALAAQVLASIAANVDGLSADPQITAKRTAIGTASGTFSTALATFAGADKKDLDAWEAVIPDPAWAVLVDYEEALAALNELSTIDPTALVTALDTAEDDYATALGAAAIASRRADYLNDAIGYSRSLLDAARAAIAARLPSAVRGDSY
jgi:hypothetical protein